MRNNKNLIFREYLREKNMFLYEAGKALGKSEATMIRMMREELSREEQMNLIAEIENSLQGVTDELS